MDYRVGSSRDGRDRELERQLGALTKESLIDILMDLSREEATFKRIMRLSRSREEGENRKRKFEDKENVVGLTNVDACDLPAKEKGKEDQQHLLSMFPLADELSAKIFLKMFIAEGKRLGPCRYLNSISI